MELTIHVHLSGALTTRRAADIAEKMKRFEARVLLRRGEMTVNGKSLMGIVSLGICEGQCVTVIADGPDEAEAAACFERAMQRN